MNLSTKQKLSCSHGKQTNGCQGVAGVRDQSGD